MSIRRYLLVRAARVAVLPLHRRYHRLLQHDSQHVEALQWQTLQRLLHDRRTTAFGHDHYFHTIRTWADYRKQVPRQTYESLEPYIEQVKNNRPDALLADGDTLRFFALTSGTTAARKFIPVTDSYLKSYKRSWSLWGVRAYRDHRPRDLALRPIVQMGGNPCEFTTPSGIPCGNLSGYTATVQRRIARRQYIVPPECGIIDDPTTRYYLALRFALSTPVALFTAANPSTLLALARTLNTHREELLRDLLDGTLSATCDMPSAMRSAMRARLKPNPIMAQQLTATATRLNRLYPQDVWPAETILIGTWTGGSMGPYLRQLAQYYGDAPIRDLGLIASEGRFTLPFANDTSSGLLDITSHVYEFIPEAEIDNQQPCYLLPHELNEGQRYYILPTTAAGLYRYHISDLVEVTGFVGKTPLLRFVGKGHRFSNLTGEKLSEYQVTQAVEAVQRRNGYTLKGFIVAPLWSESQPCYAVLLETDEETERTQQFLMALDAELRQSNTEYDAKRQSERLGPLQARMLPEGSLLDFDRERLRNTGGSPEQYKRPCLMGDMQFLTRWPMAVPITPK
jgi:hypothetical protein